MLLQPILLLPSNFRQISRLIRVHGEAQCSLRVHYLAILEEHRLVIHLTVILIDQVAALQVMALQVMAFLPITRHGVVVSQVPTSDMEAALVLILIPEGAMGGSLGAAAAALDPAEVAVGAEMAAMIVVLPGMTRSTS